VAAILNYRRNFVTGGCYFFTVNLLERQRTLLTDNIDLLRDSVRRVRRLYPFHIDAWVVLPDHLHCVLTLPPTRYRRFSCAVAVDKIIILKRIASYRTTISDMPQTFGTRHMAKALPGAYDYDRVGLFQAYRLYPR
jgi:REP element-mobilizing transposase RayT